MTTDSEIPITLKDLRKRINELNNKFTQVLLFLSFVIAAGALLLSTRSFGDNPKLWVSHAMFWWVLAIFPTIFGILPVKDKWFNNFRVCNGIRWWKVGFLWATLALIFAGAVCFLIALPHPLL